MAIMDDLLDLEGNPVTIGNAVDKDAAAGKATLLAALGPAGAREARRADRGG